MTPLVSILIPAHNAEAGIADTIRSAVGQTWKSKEIIVVDDGSSDGTLAVARQFESASVRVLDQPNQGAAAARNKAYSASQGEYIQWLDADDLLGKDKISKQMEAVATGLSRRTLLSSPWAHFIYRPRGAKFVPNDLWCDLSPQEFLLRKLSQRIFMQTAVWLVSREVTDAAGPWDTTLSHDDDGEYFCRVLLASNGIRFVPESKVYYRSVGTTARLSYVGASDAKLDSLWRSTQLHMQYLRSLDDGPRTRAACLQYLQNYLETFFPFRPDIVAQMHEAAARLQGELNNPRMSWKYSWIAEWAGWSRAKRAETAVRHLKWSSVRWWDQVLFRFERRKLTGGLGV